MKILPVDRIREADAYTILNEPIADIDLMERAATACYYWLTDHLGHEREVRVVAGTGNNGGDGFAIARLLRAKGYKVEVILAGDPEKLSPSCRINHDRWLSHPESGIRYPSSWQPTADHVIIDAVFGSGLSTHVDGEIAGLIRKINGSGAMVISVDVPSGLFCDRTVRDIKDPAVVKADHTLTFSPPKLAFMFPENDIYAGNWVLLDIGISEEYITGADTKNYFTDSSDIAALIRKRTKFQHKGHFGHALLVCGGRGKMGAAVLAARGCIRAGAGLTTVRMPESGAAILQTAVPEAMIAIDPDPDLFTTVPDLSPYTSIAIGPGIGTDIKTQNALKLLIQTAAVPLVFDADAINILGENKTWLSFIPKGSVFTPHPKEFERLAGKSPDDFERNAKQREFSFKYHCYVVLKGAHTAITTPGGDCLFNSTGNPGMATGGSGDVLTGIIAGLAAQGYSTLASALAGVYLHGLAGDLAAAESGPEALAAGDLVNYLGKAFLSLYGEL
jgi:ADP-dependent NAD(P)H-hydrate dehydratase / NAD(P)H-hydrate epimerase